MTRQALRAEISRRLWRGMIELHGGTRAASDVSGVPMRAIQRHVYEGAVPRADRILLASHTVAGRTLHYCLTGKEAPPVPRGVVIKAAEYEAKGLPQFQSRLFAALDWRWPTMRAIRTHTGASREMVWKWRMEIFRPSGELLSKIAGRSGVSADWICGAGPQLFMPGVGPARRVRRKRGPRRTPRVAWKEEQMELFK